MSLPTVARPVTRERRLERETGIEPATNSLEGCDSTTELLPPSRISSPRASARQAPPSRPASLHARHPLTCQPYSAHPLACHRSSRIHWPASRSSRSERRLVGRGGFEPPKPLGRQIYSLLRLTAPQPPRVRPPLASPEERRLSRPGVLFVDLRVVRYPADRVRVSLEEPASGPGFVELAKGFEPPTG